MYSPNHGPGYSTTPVELSNNPFINDPSNAHTRFPALSSPEPEQTQYTSWLQPQGPQQSQSQPQIQGYPYGVYGPQASQQPNNTGLYSPVQQQQQPTGLPFKPSSSFGQELFTQVNGAYGYPQQQQYSGYPTQNTNYSQTRPDVRQFDPYASIGQGWDPTPQSPSHNRSLSASSTSAMGEPHPREYVRKHKEDLERWDTYAWKQLMNGFDALKSAWEGRRREVKTRLDGVEAQMLQQQYAAYGGYGGYEYAQAVQDVERLQMLLKEADSNCDSVAASSLQMKEVQTGYRQSSDHSSKRRVRDSCNAALQGLPEWPAPAW